MPVIGIRPILFGGFDECSITAILQQLPMLFVFEAQGLPSTRYMLSAFALCGAFARMAGALQVLAVFHRLIPNISSNLGFLSLLIVMLGNFNALMVLPVAAFFSVLNVGSLALPIQFQLESALAGVIQGALVLSAVIGRGLSQWAARSGRTGKH